MFLNMPVKDLEKTRTFFEALGFSFNPQFTDDKAVCLVVNESISAMLLKEEFFKSFTKKEIVDTSASAEAIFALRVESKEQVDQYMAKALEAGASEPNKSEDYGWMYGRTFQDLDGHQWEFFYMDEKSAPQQP